MSKVAFDRWNSQYSRYVDWPEITRDSPTLVEMGYKNSVNSVIDSQIILGSAANWEFSGTFASRWFVSLCLENCHHYSACTIYATCCWSNWKGRELYFIVWFLLVINVCMCGILLSGNCFHCNLVGRLWKWPVAIICL